MTSELACRSQARWDDARLLEPQSNAHSFVAAFGGTARSEAATSPGWDITIGPYGVGRVLVRETRGVSMRACSIRWDCVAGWGLVATNATPIAESARDAQDLWSFRVDMHNDRGPPEEALHIYVVTQSPRFTIPDREAAGSFENVSRSSNA
ncbi:MAG: hypothetical protein H0U53_02110 [Actinobacteria bacterium]|nr:hypothetical protein [Actinomycetota bacterium]